MSRIGRAPITIPAGVTVTVGAENFVTVKGPKGELKQSFNTNMTISATEWKAELESQTELFAMVGDKLPAELEAQRQAMLAKF